MNKKWIFVVIILGMLAWAVYDFGFKDKASSSIKQTDVLTEENKDKKEDKNDTDKEAESKETMIKVGLEKGNLAPDFELETLDGEKVSLSDFRGKRVMLNFWATWCPPCRAEMPDMQKFHENKDVVILAVNLTETESSKDNVPTFVEDYGITFRVPLDEDSSVSTLYQIRPIPTTYLIDSNGMIHNVAFGAINYELMVQEFEKMQ
ncbi:MAG TPA: TlpA disulfide reductase family protein [Cerasibacillus sp.]|uniref:TlpA disulfide reductase family protein n=1 Tax=Cerasibacillus sp. TaxID=2498711 RepID=UPI002F4090E1